MRRPAPSLVLLIAFAAALASCASPPEPEPSPRGDGISLVVMVVVDQLRADYLERFRPVFTGGLARLLDDGAVFTDAHHNHANTSTGPGHATLSTGLEPAKSGIIGNSWRDPASGSSVYSAGLSANPSPVNLQGTALGDWMKEADPVSRVFTASPKDRSAVMLGGQGPDAAYWYSQQTGAWRSSRYYEHAARPWLEEFHQRGLLEAHFGSTWEPTTDPGAWGELDIVELDRGSFPNGFPRRIGGYAPSPEPGFYGDIYDSPLMDWYLGEFARELVVREQLGQDGNVDLLALSFSALDAVGHGYGPNSPEVLDVLVRLDGYLGELFALLDSQVGREHVLLALSSDHGVVPMPEYQEMMGLEGRRLGTPDAVCIQEAGNSLTAEFGDDRWFLRGFYLNHAAIERHGLDPAAVVSRAAELFSACAAVRRVWTASELEGEWPVDDPAYERFRNNHFPGRSPDLTLQMEPYDLWYPGIGTSHGSVYDYDSHVPLILVGPGIAAGRVPDRVATADLAPTIARLLGIAAPDGLDGVDLTDLLPRSAAER